MKRDAGQMVRRALGPGAIRAEEVEVDGETRQRLTGHAVVFNSRSLDLGGFTEVIMPGAFRETLADGHDIKMLWMHDASRPLARTGNGTLTLREDEKGLWFEALMPKTQLGRDAHEDVTTKLVETMSFGFDYGERTWKESDTLLEVRSLHLWEISPVTWPAYPAASVEARGAGVYALEVPGTMTAGAREAVLRQVREALPGERVVMLGDGVKLRALTPSGPLGTVGAPKGRGEEAAAGAAIRSVEEMLEREMGIEARLIEV